MSKRSFVDNRTITEGIGNMRGQEEISICKFGVLVNNERRHGVDNGLHAYANNMKCAESIDYIGKSMVSELKNEVNKSNFFSILIDGSTDVSCIDKEAVYILYFDPRPEGKDFAKVCLNFLGLKSVTKTDHKHLFTEAVKESLDTVLDSTNDVIRESSRSEERQSNTSTGDTTDSELTTRT